MRVIFFLFLSFILSFGNEYIISYRAIVKNHILMGEEYNVSKALSKSKSYEVVGECNLIDSKFDLDSANAIYLALKDNKDEILECFNKFIDNNIRDDVKYINNAIHSKISFSIKPQRVIAYFKDGKINIKIIKR
ncbi:hypothetical protein [Helicobacter sp. MIT 14-3879]|uniref:hypothetical protein n=1 Tax=Helicobacter sp. MIT 14-3879 TaxID=2040649 RepID=UPI000E1EA4C8|nr:hypothetical protein [Helicobacter sp. MIT 14-3879]RDU62452.1 hypothetical protein CQA44_06975 [Helicobacter sp. MIT 14-3879]